MNPTLVDRMDNASAESKAVHGQTYYQLTPWLTAQKLVPEVIERFGAVAGFTCTLEQYLEPVYEVIQGAQAEHDAAQAARKEKRKAAKASAKASGDKASADDSSEEDDDAYDSEYDDDTIWTAVKPVLEVDSKKLDRNKILQEQRELWEQRKAPATKPSGSKVTPEKTGKQPGNETPPVKKAKRLPPGASR